MYTSSSLTEQQRTAAVELFEAGFGRVSAASQLGVGRTAVRELFDRWKLYGREVLVTRTTKPRFGFEVKQEAVLRFLRGEGTGSELAREYGLSSRKVLREWVRRYRAEGVDGLRPKPRGRPPRKTPVQTSVVPDGEVERLRVENERLRAQVAYLGKLRALRDQQRP